jgi:MFS family permease
MPLIVKIRLSLMMFLEFFVWGSWYVTMGTFLGANIQAKDQDISLAFSTQSLGAILAPFLVGLIADRYFQAQKILGVIHLVGAIMLYGLYYFFSHPIGIHDFIYAYPRIGQFHLLQSDGAA